MIKKTLTTFLFLLLACACSQQKDMELGRIALDNKDWDSAVNYFLKAIRNDPKNIELRLSLGNALIAASNYHLKRGKVLMRDGRLDTAVVAFEKALEYNPDNNDARQHKHQLLKKIRALEKRQREATDVEVLKARDARKKMGKPRIDYNKKLYDLKFSRSDTRQILRALGKSAGIYFLFDDTFKSKKVSFSFENIEFTEILDRIMMETHLFYKVIDEKTILIVPDTPTKRKEYEELVMKTLFLSHNDPENIGKIVRSLTGIKTIAFDKEQSGITLKGTPELVKLAEKVVRIYDKPSGEIFVDIEIIEVNRTRVREYGIELSQYSVTGTYVPDVDGTNASMMRADMLTRTDLSDYMLTIPAVTYKLLKTDQNSRIKARPQLRVLDRQQVQVRLGDKVPIPTTSFVPYNTAGPAQQPITSYQMQDIGINIDLTPRIHHDGMISMKMKFELTFITNPGTESLPPTIGNRTVDTTIKLRDNETSIMAGLLRDTERKSLQGIPFLSELPVLKRLFSSNKNEIEQTDIILTITPRIVRFPEVTEEDLELLWVGTNTHPGLKEAPSYLVFEDEKENQIEPAIIKKSDTQKLPGTFPPKSHPVKKDSTQPKSQSMDDVTPKSPPKKVEHPQTEPASSPLQLRLKLPHDSLKKGNYTNVAIVMSSKAGKPIKMRTLNLIMEIDPAMVEIGKLYKGAALITGGVKSHLLKNVDAKKGKIKLNVSLENPLTISTDTEIAVIQVKPLATGTISFVPTLARVYDESMKKITVNFKEQKTNIPE